MVNIMETRVVNAGIDVGSTTIKLVVMDENHQVLYKKYERHYSDIKQATRLLFEDAAEVFGGHPVRISTTGSGGMGISEVLDIEFIQEVIACSLTVETLIPETDVSIELGGEDAKITFFGASLEQRMNGSCAGGTGAFIDQMAQILNTDAAGVNELSKKHKKIYPIASRCGVFAKTDVQPLINDGVSKADIAASVLQAVVNQTITGLASGRQIEGKVAFLGGPLYFMSELRERFIETLELGPEEVIFPQDPQLYVAMGAALNSADQEEATSFSELYEKVTADDTPNLAPTDTLDPLFENEEELAEFRERHARAAVEEAPLADYSGVAFLGIDAGSTTTKMTLIDPEGRILWDTYDTNDGDPLEKSMEMLLELYDLMPEDVYIGNAVTTGYGEALIKNALKVDEGEVETMCHYRAAEHFSPGVDFVLDIGGQDMKAMKAKDGVLSSIQLNEACSSGCGSFIETLANSLQYDVYDFADEALKSRAPVDLGSRCTVFMNSKVKQTQKEGASIADISAGLSISVIKNALYKVIKVQDPKRLGEKIVCQGGTFYNDSILRAFEKITGREVIRPNIAGLMGAYGCALIALDHYEIGTESMLLGKEDIQAFTSEKEYTRCGLCANNCELTITLFNDGRRFVSGNRCERGEQKGMGVALDEIKSNQNYNLIDYKYERLFNYKPLRKREAARGSVGIIRAMNMYENYPLWHTFFTELGFQVRLSSPTSDRLYEKGISSIPDDTVCYPAKLAHGHIEDLIRKKPDFIFYPCVNYEKKEVEDAPNSFNCPIIISYPQVIRNNVDAISRGQVDYRSPHLNFTNEDHMVDALTEMLEDKEVSREEVQAALDAAMAEMENYRQDIQAQGEEILMHLRYHPDEKGIVVAGRPYHSDPEINHGVADVMAKEGFHILTEDSISHLANVGGLRVVDQWVYHSRLYAAAKLACKIPNLELVQLNSFGCGIDAVTGEQVQEILEQYGKIHTLLKIDEGSNLGAVRIRIRSLKAAMVERDRQDWQPDKLYEMPSEITFTKDMRQKHTLLLPMMSPIHQEGLIDEAFRASGYNVVQIGTETGDQGIQEGLNFVNNDACYPAIITIGQLIDALKSGDYDVDNTSVMMTQTGGGCRATNYIPLLRKALHDAGFPQVPVVSISTGISGTESNQGFRFTLPMLGRLGVALLYGDLFQKLLYGTRPYELEERSADALYEEWLERIQPNVRNGSLREFNKNMKEIIEDFDTLPRTGEVKPRVGIVGEILVKYSPTANNGIVDLLEAEGAEAVVPDLMGFLNYCLYNMQWRADNLGFKKVNKPASQFAIKFIQLCEKPMNKALEESEHFEPFHAIEEIALGAESIISIGSHTGEGWYLTGEVVQFVKSGVPNVVITQPFGCLPNHVVGRGMMKEIRYQHPEANLTAIDYDPGVSEVNQLNRIRLMLAQAHKKLEEETVK